MLCQITQNGAIALGLDLTQWFLSEALGITSDGSTIVGWGFNPAGQREAWRVNIAAVPEPSSAALGCLGIVGLAIARTRKARRRMLPDGSSA
jgi:hypothetical protein